MTALRWTRRSLDLLLLVAVLVVIGTAGITVLAPFLGGRALVIGGGSMDPAIPQGALVVALPSDAPYVVGDVVTVRQGAATPYTHRVTRLTELAGVPYVETKGDANPEADPVIVPTSAIVGRVVLAVPVLGFVSALLGTALGLAGFLALCATALLLIWILEELEEQRCPECAAAHAARGRASPASELPGHRAPAPGAAAAGMLGALPSFAAPRRRAGVRETGRARAAGTPVLLERDRRDPRRRGVVTVPAPAGPSPEEQAAGSEPSVDIRGDLAA